MSKLGVGALALCVSSVSSLEVAISQCELERLDVDASFFGRSNSCVYGNRIIFGTPFDEKYGHLFGNAFVFQRHGDDWVPEELFVPPDLAAVAYFGSSVALGEGFALIGAIGDDDGNQDAGAVYVYRLVESTWVLEGKFIEPTPREFGEFGRTILLDGDRLFVGAPGRRGAVHYYERNGAVWEHRQEIQGRNQADLGLIMAFDGSTLALVDRRNGGSVHLFEFEDGSWVETGSVAPDGGNGGFGEAIGIQGDTLAVAQLRTFEPDQWVFLYEKANGTWNNRQTLITRHNPYSEITCIAFEGDYLAIGDDGLPDQVDIFYRSGLSGPMSPTNPSSYWQHIAEIPGQDDEDKDFGDSLSMESNVLVIGARQAPPFVWTLAESLCCRPHFACFGDGTAGSLGFVPSLTGDGEDCTIGASRFLLIDGLGGAAGLLLVSAERSETPFHEGTLYIEAPWYSFSLLLKGEPGLPGSGSAELPMPSIRALLGTTLFTQAVVLDWAADHGVALSNGLRFQIGAN